MGKHHTDDTKMTEENKDALLLASYIEKIERIETEKSELSADIREIYAEAKGSGFDTKVMRQIIKLRKMMPADRAESEFLREEYKKLLKIDD